MSAPRCVARGACGEARVGLRRFPAPGIAFPRNMKFPQKVEQETNATRKKKLNQDDLERSSCESAEQGYASDSSKRLILGWLSTDSEDDEYCRNDDTEPTHR